MTKFSKFLLIHDVIGGEIMNAKTAIESMWKDVAILEVPAEITTSSGATREGEVVTREVIGMLVSSNKPQSDYGVSRNTAQVKGSMLFITSASEVIPTSSKLTIRGVEFVTGFPMSYTIHQEIPVSFKEVH